jgi:hypothetical protein
MDWNLVWRRTLSVFYADLIVATAMFAVTGVFLLMWSTILLSAFLWGGYAFILVAAFWCVFTAPYALLLIVLVRSAWSLPKELWRKPVAAM